MRPTGAILEPGSSFGVIAAEPFPHHRFTDTDLLGDAAGVFNAHRARDEDRLDCVAGPGIPVHVHPGLFRCGDG